MAGPRRNGRSYLIAFLKISCAKNPLFSQAKMVGRKKSRLKTQSFRLSLTACNQTSYKIIFLKHPLAQHLQYI
ncbi:MAG: hypothetical protein A2173_09765 [Planctomycetes bacterium RBG_13_44_8b]|nr:MAG: hypothetical protein A2173_09765 [Planctomycetes bacterium RBG_13_44_8b]